VYYKLMYTVIYFHW